MAQHHQARPPLQDMKTAWQDAELAADKSELRRHIAQYVFAAG